MKVLKNVSPNIMVWGLLYTALGRQTNRQLGVVRVNVAGK